MQSFDDVNKEMELTREMVRLNAISLHDQVGGVKGDVEAGMELLGGVESKISETSRQVGAIEEKYEGLSVLLTEAFRQVNIGFQLILHGLTTHKLQISLLQNVVLLQAFIARAIDVGEQAKALQLILKDYHMSASNEISILTNPTNAEEFVRMEQLIADGANHILDEVEHVLQAIEGPDTGDQNTQ